jgi:hypothetical protein
MDIQTFGLLWVVAAFFMGLLNCFFGYRLFIVIVALLGLTLGASLGYLIGSWMEGGIVTLVLVMILGLIGAWASVSGYYAFIFVVGAFGFALLAAFVSGIYSQNVSVLLLILVGLVGGFVALWLQRIIIIIATAAQGALASVLAVAALVSGGGLEAYRGLFYRFLDGDLARTGGVWFYVGTLLWLIVFAFGLVAQFTRGKEMYRRQRT